MDWLDVFKTLGVQIASRAQLLAAGATGPSLTAAVRYGHLIRARRDHYALPSIDGTVLQAVRVGGRLGCLSALREMGVYASDDDRFPHFHIERELSRPRSPRRRDERLTIENRDGATLHWGGLLEPAEATEVRVGVLDALAHAVRCQSTWHAIASLDNALFLEMVTEQQLATLFAELPARFQSLLPLIDGRAESGQESVLRGIVRETGYDYEVQAQIPWVGRVDMVVDGRLVLEADSRLAHEGWKKQVRDRTRDLHSGRGGLMTLRPLYQHIMFSPDLVREAIVALLRA